MMVSGELTVLIRSNANFVAASLSSVFEVLAASDAALNAVSHSFPEFFGIELDSGALYLREDPCDPFLGETIIVPAGGAVEIVIQPSDIYLKFVSAVAAYRDDTLHVERDFDGHGWPILTVVRGSSTVAETGGALKSPPAEGSK